VTRRALVTALGTALGTALAAALAGCSDDGSGEPDAAIDADPGCVAPRAPVEEPPWLADYLSDQVATLAAAPRASAAQRTEAREYLSGELRALGYVPTSFAYDSGANVGAVLSSTIGSDATVLFGAHYDSVSDSPGANDNATGVAVVLAVARALADQPCRTARLELAFFDQEEVGLIGSGVYAAALRADDANMLAVHTIDQVGWDADDDLRFEVERPAPGMLARYEEAAAAVGAGGVFMTNVSSTDHESFRQQGFAAAGLTEEYAAGDTTPHYHMPTDRPATVDAVYHRVAARMMIYLLAREIGAVP
jgi:hypothetical protein